MATPKSISTMKAFRVLRTFRQRGEALTNAQISRRCGLPASSVRRLLLTLCEIGAVERADEVRYRLGALMHSLGRDVVVRDCLLRAARPELAKLHQRTGLPVSMAVLEGQMLVCVAALALAGVRRSQAGARYEPYPSAMGRILLAALPAGQLEKFLFDDLVALTPFTITDRDVLRGELAKIREEGLAVEREESYMGTGCIAVPVRDDNDRIYAAIAISEAAYGLSPARICALQDELMAAASAIQRQLFPPSRRGSDTSPGRGRVRQAASGAAAACHPAVTELS